MRTTEADSYATIVIAGFFTGGALAIRGGFKAARNSAIACGCLLAVIEGVGIGFQRMMAENTRLDVSILDRCCVKTDHGIMYFGMLILDLVTTTPPSSRKCSVPSDVSVALSDSCILSLHFHNAADNCSPLYCSHVSYVRSSEILHGR